MALERELEFFNQWRMDWLREHEGKFALVVSDTLEGFYDTAEHAYEFGVKKHGNIPMLIHEVTPQETTEQMPMLALLHGHAGS